MAHNNYSPDCDECAEQGHSHLFCCSQCKEGRIWLCPDCFPRTDDEEEMLSCAECFDDLLDDLK
jgi:hypothetical protein